jgi:ABC-type transport system involved in multi-copper enzyme maturation permease subunit
MFGISLELLLVIYVVVLAIIIFFIGYTNSDSGAIFLAIIWPAILFYIFVVLPFGLLYLIGECFSNRNKKL